MRFDLTDLRLFLRVVEAGSITHGATEANLALPSASARLRSMEDMIGLPLLVRNRRGIELTPAGDSLAHHARIILRQVEQMRGELGGQAKGLKTRIQLLANTAATTEFLPGPLAGFLAAHPKVDLDLRERPSVEIVKAVAGGFAELGIISDAVDPGCLELLPFAIDRLVLVAARANPLSARRSIAFQEVLGRDFVGLSPGSPLQDFLGDKAARAGHPLGFRIRIPTFEGICQLVARDVGIGILPHSAAARWRRSMAIRPVKLTDPWATRRLSLCMLQFEALPGPTRELVRHLAAPRG
ncbi:MAG: LysR family transcriptional regulator [Holophaga sp.]|nr:LysR family transcriptional regulator [Holophaga sp.]